MIGTVVGRVALAFVGISVVALALGNHRVGFAAGGTGLVLGLVSLALWRRGR